MEQRTGEDERTMADTNKNGDEGPALVWFTRDLRLDDHAALHAAVESGRAVVACYVLDEAAGGDWAPGACSRWWLHHSLASLAKRLKQVGLTLVLRRGDAKTEVLRLIEQVGAGALHVGQPNEPAGRAALDAIEAGLDKLGCELHRHWTTLLFDPDSIRTGSGGIYGVFTPFSKACIARGVDDDLLGAPRRVKVGKAPKSDELDSWKLLPTKDWYAGLGETWTPGEDGAREALAKFVEAPIKQYATARNLPGIEGVSRLSPHLHWGELSPRAVWHAAMQQDGKGPQTFRSELLWREFSAHLLWHYPTLPDAPLKQAFERMEWRRAPSELRAWQRGQTGIPIVDAGMRQLWFSGWQHNRVRLITASFLIKHLLIEWKLGEAWFWDCLVDADLGSNSQNWQWVAGCGADASPFFRVFNPWLQGQKFDADGDFVRQWVPELGKLSGEHIHAPWEAPAEVLEAAGVVLGKTYPKPIVDLKEGRERALAAFKHVSDKVAA